MSEIARIVRKEVQEAGVIPFAEFMRLALYCPKYGYYEQISGRIGRKGDFYTSPTVGGLFGELLAFQFAEWLERLPRKPLQLVEAGAHEGQLAADILSWLRQNRPQLLNCAQYWIVEPSSARQAWQRKKLDDFAHQVRWFESLASLSNAKVNGVIFSNELLDAMPVHRLGWDASAQRWFEWGVAIDRRIDDGFVWKRISRPTGYLANHLRQAGLELPPEALAVLPDGFTVEISTEAAAWWRQAAKLLSTGRLLTFDYGFQAPQLFAPERAGGTLRAYYRHHASADLLARPGEQDLTAHVNFTQLQRTGEEAGLRTEGLLSQERFLTPIAGKLWHDESVFDQRKATRLRQFTTLAHPEHFGRFAVLVQVR